MSPEFGATATLFPIDDETLAYLRLTGRADERVDLVERYAKEQGLWREPGDGPDFDDALELDLATVEPSLAGPRRPQDRVAARGATARARTSGSATTPSRQARMPASDARRSPVEARPTATRGDGGRRPIESRSASRRRPTGSVAIAAITSCTNTSNPTVMVGAGLLARNAVARGLRSRRPSRPPSRPGRKAVTEYLERAGLLEPLAALGFALAGYGCTTCIGNSGPLDEPIARPSRATSWSSRPCCRATATSRAASTRRCGPRTSPRRRWSSPSRSRAGSTSTSRPSRWAPARRAAGVPGRHLADAGGDPRGHRPSRRRRSCSGGPTPASSRATSAGARCPIPDGRPLRLGRRLDLRRAAAVLRGPDGSSRRRSTDIDGARVLALLGDSVTTDHISPGRLDRRPGDPPASGSRSTASRRSSSTATARGAATTR